MNWIQGKSVLISGVSSGIGKEFCSQLIEKFDCNVYGIARNESKILKLKEELGEKSNKFKDYFLFDVSKEENWKELAEKLKSNNIEINIVINCAGILPKFQKFGMYECEEFENIFDTDFYSCVYCARHIYPVIKNNSTPAIINVSSSSALFTFAGISGYSAAKAALKQFTLALCEEYGKEAYFGCICPGFTRTNIFSSQDISEKDFKLTEKVSSDCGKIVKKCLRRIKRKKVLSIVGYDAKLMNFFYKIAPVLTARLMTKLLRKSKIKLFENI